MGDSVSGSVLDGDVAAERVGRTSAVVVVEHLGHLGNLASVLLLLGLEATGENGAVLNAAREVGASVDGRLEGIDVPSVHEIGVVTTACFELDVLSYEQNE
jgi:hypothetical protein